VFAGQPGHDAIKTVLSLDTEGTAQPSGSGSSSTPEKPWAVPYS
jgi:hypothetical protein